MTLTHMTSDTDLRAGGWGQLGARPQLLSGVHTQTKPVHSPRAQSQLAHRVHVPCGQGCPLWTRSPREGKGQSRVPRGPVHVLLLVTFPALGCSPHRPDIPTARPLSSPHQNQRHQWGLRSASPSPAISYHPCLQPPQRWPLHRGLAVCSELCPQRPKTQRFNNSVLSRVKQWAHHVADGPLTTACSLQLTHHGEGFRFS